MTDGRLTVRRVVTGHDEHGKSVILSDGASPQFSDRAMFAEIWNTEGSPARIAAVEQHEPNDRPLQLAPPPGGSIIRVVEMGAGHRSAMHCTRTVDCGSDGPARMVFVLVAAEFDPELEAALPSMQLVP